MRRGGRRGEAPPEYLDDDEQEAVIARFEASMQATRDAWMRLLCALSLGCSVGVGVASLLDLPFLPALVHRTTLVTGAFPSSQYAGPVAVAAAELETMAFDGRRLRLRTGRCERGRCS